jgi:hypothetical protein
MWQEYNHNLPDKYAWTTNDIAVTNTNIVLSSGASGFYYLRPKGSALWIESRIQTPDGININTNAFLAIGNIIFSGSRFGIYRSMDNGVTWDSVGIRALPLSAVTFAKDNNRIYVGFTRSGDFFVWYSDDMGDTWDPLDHQFHNLKNLYIYDNKIWAATVDGFYYNPLQPTSIGPIVNPAKFSLSQNYPNPFNPNTKISWQSPHAGYQTLKVFDILGNEVAKLVDEFREAGNYEVNFDASKLASGVYVYRIEIHSDRPSTGGIVSSKKMLLLK